MLSEKNRLFRTNCDKRTTTNTSGPAFLSSAACIPHLKIIISFCLSYVKLILGYNLSYDKLYSILYPYKTAAPIFSRGSGFVAKRKPLAELVERKSLRLWRKIKLLVKVKLGLPTNKTRNKEDLIVDKDISSLEHTRWRCQYHVVFAPRSNEERILSFVASNGYIVRGDVDLLLGVSQATSNRILKRMVTDGLLYRDGSGRKTKYKKLGQQS